MAKRNSSPNDSTKEKKMEMFVFDGVKKELTSKITELMHRQWMEQQRAVPGTSLPP